MNLAIVMFVLITGISTLADTNSPIPNGQLINKTSAVPVKPSSVTNDVKSDTNIGAIHGVVVDQGKTTQSQQQAQPTTNHYDFILKVLDSKVVSGILSVAAGVVGFFFGKWYDQKNNYRKETQRYRSCLKAAENELRFYKDKLHQASGELGKMMDDVTQSSGSRFILPSYSFYPDFLQNVKIELAGFFQDVQFVKDVGNCHFELCHIVERFDWVKKLSSEQPAFILANVSNIGGVKGLIDKNENTFLQSADLIQAEIVRLDQLLGSK